MDHALRCLVAELCAAKSEHELERVLDAIRARGKASLRATATSLTPVISGLSPRLQRAAIELAVEVGGEEGRRLLRALIEDGAVDTEERAAAVCALASDTSHETMATLLSVLSNEGRYGDTELSIPIVEHLSRVPSDFDWSDPVRAIHGSSLNDLLGILDDNPRPALAALCAVVEAEARTRRGPSMVYQRYGIHHPMVPPLESAGPVYNPYLEEFERWHHRACEDDRFWGDRGQERILRSAYAYAVPTRAALRRVALYAPIVEIGAGAGYWAWLLRQMGVEIVAYDHEPPDGTYRNGYFEGGRAWTEVRRGGPEMVREHPNHALFLCWPPPSTPMAEECLEAFTDNTILYTGEWRRSSATSAFFDALEASFEQIAMMPLPSWLVEDALRIFRRRTRR